MCVLCFCLVMWALVAAVKTSMPSHEQALATHDMLSRAREELASLERRILAQREVLKTRAEPPAPDRQRIVGLEEVTDAMKALGERAVMSWLKIVYEA